MTKRPAIGKLIVFEGTDGVGKTTLAQQLSARLNDSGVSCEYLAFPGKDLGSLGRLVYDIHHDRSEHIVNDINPTSLQVLHIAAHIDVIEKRILPALKAGRWIVLDRFWWSTWVYGMALGIAERSLKAMLRLEQLHWKRIKPSIVFLVERIPTSPNQGEDSWQAIGEGYLHLANREKIHSQVQTIQNKSSVEDALNVAWAAIGSLLPRPASTFPSGHTRLHNRQLALLANNNTHISQFSRRAFALPSVVYDTYWHFAAARQEVFFRKLENFSSWWTNDPILRRHKFTNSYRASDRVSQYLIRHVIYEGDQSPQEVFFRTILFKFFNKIETWELLITALGELSYRSYSFDSYDRVLAQALVEGRTIYSAAYIMPSAGRVFGYSRKHSNHLKLIERMMTEEVPNRIRDAHTMRDAFNILRSYPSIGSFLAYQFVIDLNYSQLTDFSEMDFVVPGPGALDGIFKCFVDLRGLSGTDIIRAATDHQEAEFERLGLNFRSLWGRRLQLVDCQNLFCEVSKYARLKHPDIKGIGNRSRIKQIYRPSEQSIDYWYPPKWGINNLVPQVGKSNV